MNTRNIPWWQDWQAYCAAIVLLMLCTEVFAQSPSTIYSIGAFSGNNATTVCQSWASSLQTPDVCGSQATAIDNNTRCQYFLQQTSGGTCSGPYQSATNSLQSSGEQCPGGAVFDGNGGCICPPPSVWNGSECYQNPAEPCPEAPTVPNSEGFHFFGTSPPSSNLPSSPSLATLACSNNKRVVFKIRSEDIISSNVTYFRSLNNGEANYYLRGSYEYLCDAGNMHEPCVSGDAPSSESASTLPPDTCPSGYTIGVINGKNVCFSNTTSEPINPHTGTEAATSGSTTTQNSGGGGGYTTVTNNADGSQTTTVTDSSGNVVSKTVTPPIDPSPQSEFCKEKPNDPLCTTGTISGSCQSDYQCTGDAIQCAQAKAAYQITCEMQRRMSSTSLGEAVLAGNDPDAANLPRPSSANVVNVSGMLNTSGFLAASACPPDQSFIIAGSEFVIPWSRLCGIFQTLGYVLIVIASIASARIVMGSKS